MRSLSDYGLVKPSFQLDPELDCKIFVGRPDVKERLESRLSRAIVTETSMHTMIYGEYGSGKTHTLNYVRKFLDEKKLPVISVYVRSPNVEQRSKPSDLFGSIIASISPLQIFSLFTKIYDSVQMELQKTQDVYQRIAIIERVTGNRDLANVIHKYVTTRPSGDYLIIKWLSGEKISAKEKTELSVVQDNSDQYAAVQTLLSLLRMFNEFERKYVLLLLDEMEGLSILSSRSLEEFGNFLRPLVELRSGIAVLLAFTSHAGLDDALPIFSSGSAVGSRVGYPQNYIFLKPFDDPDSMKQFVRELLRAVRDPKADIKSLVKTHGKGLAEKPSDSFYPFTEEAVGLIFQQYSQTSQAKPILPRDILKIMTDCLGDAISEDKVVITTDLVQRIMKE